MNFLSDAVLEQAGRLAAANPQRWIYGWAAAGTILAVAIYGALGWGIGALVGHAQAGAYAGWCWNGYWFATQVDELKCRADQQVELLEQLVKDAGL